MEFKPVVQRGLQESTEFWRDYAVDGYIVVYSITDRRSFQKAVDVVVELRQHAKLRPSKAPNKPLLLVANKSDLERARVVAKEGPTPAPNSFCIRSDYS